MGGPTLMKSLTSLLRLWDAMVSPAAASAASISCLQPGRLKPRQPARPPAHAAAGSASAGSASAACLRCASLPCRVAFTLAPRALPACLAA